MKRISVALAILGLSTGALAAYPASTDPSLITIPLLPGGFFIGGSLFYLQPSVTNGLEDNTSVPSGTTPSFFSSLSTIDPGYDWGWGVNAGYIFPNTGNDIQLNYFNYDSDDSDTAPVFTITAGDLILENEINRHKLENDINQLDLTVGQFIDVGCRLIMHPFTGLRWLDLEQKRSRFNQFTFDAGELGTFDETFTEHNKSEFEGIGPILGLDASYYLGWGFGAVGHFDSAVLVGDMDHSSNATTVIAEVGGPTTTTFNSASAGDITRVVPIVDAKLGFDYTYLFYNTANSDLTLEVGWQFSKYFNAVETIGNVLTVPTRRTTANLALQGPYATLVWHI